MKTYGLQEHTATADVVDAWRRADPSLEEPMMKLALASDITPALLDLDVGRIAAMDGADIDVAVLSLTTPGLQNPAAAEAAALQEPTNDAFAAAVGRRPDRLQGFAALATPAPAAATELRRKLLRNWASTAHCSTQAGELRDR